MAAIASRGLSDGIDDGYDLYRRRVLQRNDLDIVFAFLVDTADDSGNAPDIRSAVGNDQHIGLRIGREMTVLRNQRPQNWHQLSRNDIFYPDNPGHDFIGSTGARGRAGDLSCIGIGQNLDEISGRNRNVSVNLQQGLERIVKGV